MTPFHSAAKLMLSVFVALLILSADQYLCAQSLEEPKISQLNVGFGGVYKLGCWAPVEVILVGGTESYTGRVLITAPDSDGVPTTVVSPTERPVGIRPGQATVVRLNIRVGQSNSPLNVKFFADGKVRTERTFYTGPEAGEGMVLGGAPATNRILLEFGPALGLGDLVRDESGEIELLESRIAHLESAANLPTQWFGYEGLETVVLSTSQVELYRPLFQNPGRVEALRQWVELGGKLVVFCGQSAEELLGKDGPLAPLMPGNFEKMVPLRQPQAIESFSGSDQSIPRNQRLDLQVPQLTNVQGKILAHAGREETNLPLVVQSRLGLGELVFVGLDFDRPPLRDWAGRTSFLRKVLNFEHRVATDQSTGPTYGGADSDDMTAKLRIALDKQFTGVQIVPFALIALLVVGYILLIGPGDYFLVKKILGRAELTWLTFPAIVVGISAAAYWFANWSKGDQLRVNQIEVVDVDSTNKFAHGTVFTHFFTPQVDQFHLTIQPNLLGSVPPQETTQLVSWLGLPGYAMGGMQGNRVQSSVFDRGYSFGESLASIQGMPVQVWSTKTITARWTAPIGEPLQATLRRSGEELLQGSIVNHSELFWHGAILLYGRWAYPLGRLTPGASLAIGEDDQPRTVKTLLTSATAGDQTVTHTADDGTIPFRLAEDDVTRLAKIMMFFEAIDGHSYTGGYNRYQASLDLSHMLAQENIAILLAQTHESSSQWFHNDQPIQSDEDHHWTFYRFILPVAEKEK